ncbi:MULTISPECIES: hypothetical protein [Natrialbaceae]|uniref:hypothetical protein n=1 Tax=Natrialbaceae TaxID=1644061 RepID=UPI00207D2B19|nr:hypothetical protein [Natronococcus sp. CG52]
MQGLGGLAAVSMSGATVAEAEEALTEALPTDPHTRDTYRAIVDAIIPETPQLEDELGPEHVPGGLEVELEKFLVWDFNHFHEIRLETLANTGGTDPVTDDAPSADQLELSLEPGEADSDLDALLEVDGIDTAVIDAVIDDLNDLLATLSGGLLGSSDEITTDDFEETLDFGTIEALEITIDETVDEDETGPVDFDVFVETANETSNTAIQNYPYASLFTIVFDIVATEFILLGKNEDAIDRGNEEFPAGGTFVQLSREDRLRCLWSIVDGGAIDRLDGLLEPIVTDVGILKFVVMAVNGLHGFGYYTEWSGYEDTKTATPTDRALNVPPGKVQSRRQTEYPGPQSGHAADWRHAVPGGFDDPEADELDLDSDLKGDDVLEGIGGDTP